MPEKVDASPTKEFFVHMVTRDISLEDCILDLLDNSVDGARRYLAQQQNVDDGHLQGEDGSLNGFGASIAYDSSQFTIRDNCGGISIENAKEHAFHFGRRADVPLESEHSIGLYGIGMKRAVLKMGRTITIESSTDMEAFVVHIDVDKWLAKPTEWDFTLEEISPWPAPGTSIRIRDLYDDVKTAFNDNVFASNLHTILARDYAFILNAGFSIEQNAKNVVPFTFEVSESDFFKPARFAYEDPAGVTVEIVVGMADVPPEDPSAEEMESEFRRETKYFGWFVVCNDRVVLAADRSDRTVWGHEGFTRWHFQYNGFMGLAFFTSSDPRKLPWTTTKRDIDETNPVYRRAVTKMKDVTRPWIAYTTARKRDIDKAKSLESVAVGKPVRDVLSRDRMELPKIDSTPAIKMASIQYQKPLADVNKVRKALGRGGIPYTEVGRLTFEYFMENEAID